MLVQHLLAIAAVGATFLAVGLLQSTVVDLPAAVLLYLVPIVLAASRWSRGPAITAVVTAILGQDLLFAHPRGTFSVAPADEALGLVLLFTALVTAQLADGTRRGAESARAEAVARRSDELRTALRAVTYRMEAAAPQP